MFISGYANTGNILYCFNTALVLWTNSLKKAASSRFITAWLTVVIPLDHALFNEAGDAKTPFSLYIFWYPSALNLTFSNKFPFFLIVTSVHQALHLSFPFLTITFLKLSLCFHLRSKNNGSWSSVGCRLVKKFNRQVTCTCNHLTNFAVLMQVGGNKASEKVSGYFDL